MTDNETIIIHILRPKVYEYQGVLFELAYHGPWPLRKDGTPRKYLTRKFYRVYDEFEKLSEEEKAKLEVK